VENVADILAFSLNRKDHAPFILAHYSMSVAVPFVRNAGIWSYNQTLRKGNIQFPVDRPSEMHSFANIGIPFIVQADKAGVNLLSVGVLSQHHNVALRGEPNKHATKYEVSAPVISPAVALCYEDGFYISRAQRTWYEEAQAYTRLVDAYRGYQPLPPPAHTYNPTYDSWYWTLDQISQSLVWHLAKRAQKIGFKSYLIDSGWDTWPGEYFNWLDGSTGDYQPLPSLFPDFAGLLNQMRYGLGMRVMLWMQQYALGRRSIYYPQLQDALSYTCNNCGDLEETPGSLSPRGCHAGAHHKFVTTHTAGLPDRWLLV
jgi:hypothetical protein